MPVREGEAPAEPGERGIARLMASATWPFHPGTGHRGPPMRILVTGVTGFVGGHLAEALLATAGWSCTASAGMPTGRHPCRSCGTE